MASREVCAVMRAAARATRGRLIAAVLVLGPLVACSAIPATSSNSGVASWDGSTVTSVALVDSAVADAPYVDASACRPGDVQTFAPTAYRSAAGKYQGVCTTNAMEALYEHCFDPAIASPNACQDDKLAYPACAACVLTPDDATHYGPLLTDSTDWVRPNVAGCIELSDPNTAGLACAKGFQVLTSCELEACEANCPVTGYVASSLAAYTECAAQADATGCAPFVSAAACAEPDASAGPSDAGDAIALCLEPMLEAFYFYAVPMFCGAPPPDGSASSDSSSSSPAIGASASVAASSSAAGDAGTN